MINQLTSQIIQIEGTDVMISFFCALIYYVYTKNNLNMHLMMNILSVTDIKFSFIFFGGLKCLGDVRRMF